LKTAGYEYESEKDVETLSEKRKLHFLATHPGAFTTANMISFNFKKEHVPVVHVMICIIQPKSKLLQQPG
jgi:predicted transcriptional regulator